MDKESVAGKEEKQQNLTDLTTPLCSDKLIALS